MEEAEVEETGTEEAVEEEIVEEEVNIVDEIKEDLEEGKDAVESGGVCGFAMKIFC